MSEPQTVAISVAPISPTVDHAEMTAEVGTCSVCQGEEVWMLCDEDDQEFECGLCQGEDIWLAGVVKKPGKEKVRAFEEVKKKREKARSQEDEADDEARAAVEEGGEAE